MDRTKNKNGFSSQVDGEGENPHLENDKAYQNQR